MATYHVKQGGNDLSDGLSDATAFATCGKALSILVPGDSILIKNDGGNYQPITITHKPGTAAAKYTLGTYGTGPGPTISSFVTPSWINEDSNIWSYHNPDFIDVTLVKINGVNQPKGRWPKSGYLTVTGANGNTQIFDSVNLPTAPNFTGGELVAKKEKWIKDVQRITSQTSLQITTEAASNYSYRVGYGYFIQNHRNCLDLPGEWYYDKAAKKVYLYSVTNPNSIDIRISRDPHSIYLNHSPHWEIQGLKAEGSAQIGAYIRYSAHVQLRDCRIEFHGNTGVQTYVSPHLTVDDCDIYEINNNGINNRDASPDFTAINNRIQRIAMIPGASGSGDLQACGIIIGNTEKNAVIRNNQLRQLGYIGVYYAGDDCLVEKNYGEHGCLVKSDGALFYTFGPYDGIRCRDNVAVGCIGNVEGTTHSNYFGIGDSAGFYYDDNGRNISFDRNVAEGCFMGFYLHNVQDVTGTGNVAYNNHVQCRLADDKWGDPLSGLSLTGNTWIARAGQLIYEIRTTRNRVSFGNVNHNRIQSADNKPYRIRREVIDPSVLVQNFDDFRLATGYDSDFQQHVFDEANHFILVNESGATQSVPLAGIYKDLSGEEYTGSIALETNASIYLVKTADLPPTDPVDPTPVPEEVDFSLSIRIPSQVYRTILAAVRPFKSPE